MSICPAENRLPNNSKRPPMEVTLHAEHYGLALLNTLLLVGPLTRELDGRFDGLSTSVHWQYHIVFEQGCYLLGEGPET